MSVKVETSAGDTSEASRIRANVKLVLARVVVRDASGHAIGNLHKEDFELFDNGKKQLISAFDVGHIAPSASVPMAVSTSTTETMPAVQKTPQKAPEFPARYVAYVFDDLRLEFADLARVREAALRHMEKLVSTDRAAIYTTSGKTLLDFTDDRSQLGQTLENLRPRPTQVPSASNCPDISVYMADLIVNKNDPAVEQAALNDYLVCAGLVKLAGQTNGLTSAQRSLGSQARSFVQNTAMQVLEVGEEESRKGLQFLQNTVVRMSALPSQKSIVLISPGFLTTDLDYEYNTLIDRALRVQVTINCLDARGLYVTIPFGDASQQGRGEHDIAGQAFLPASRAMLDTQAASAEGDILAVFANSTGGVLFKNNNDMDEGFRRVSDAPEFWYVLGFRPENLKSDGKFHTLKVGLTNRQKYDLQSRRGYYAPRHDIDSAEEAKREIDDELFSNEELHNLPVELHTQFFKTSDDTAKLTVLAHVDVKRLRYKQVQDRNQNDLTLVTAVFDRNGNILHSVQKLVQMRWKNETLQARLGSGITLRASFEVKPGKYLVRIVARDTEQQALSAENGAVEIP